MTLHKMVTACSSKLLGKMSAAPKWNRFPKEHSYLGFYPRCENDSLLAVKTLAVAFCSLPSALSSWS